MPNSSLRGGSSWDFAVEKELLILQGNFPGTLALAVTAQVGQMGASSRGFVLTDRASAARPWPAALYCVGVPFTAFFVSLFKNLRRTFFAEWFQAGVTHLEGIVTATWLAKGVQRTRSLLNMCTQWG